MPDFELRAEPRAVLGKKVAGLRRNGLTPANIYGHNVPSTAIQVVTLELAQTLRQVGRTHLLRMTVGGEGAPRMVLVRNVSRKPTTDQLLHIDFYQVSMTEKTTVNVPVVLVGSAPIAESGDGLVVAQVSTLALESLPANIPNRIEVDIAVLTDLHSVIRLSDLTLPPDATAHADPSEVIVSVSQRVAAEEVEAAAEAAAAEEVAAEPEREQPGESA